MSEMEIPSSEPIGDEIGSPETHYKFDEGFQAKISALCLRDTGFMQRAEGLVKPEYLENIADAILVNIANRYFEKYRKVPGDQTVLAALLRHDLINKIVKKEHVGLAIGRAKELWGHDISDKDFVIDQVATFARHQALSKAILDSVEHLDLNEFEKINSSIKKALDVGERSDAGAYDYGEMIAVRTEERLDRAAGKLPPTGITTGYAEIDRHLYHKGWGKRELSVLMGGAKAGKTTALLDFGISACGHLHRYNVLYITLEVSAQIISERLDARISQYFVNELGSHIHEVDEKVKSFMDRAGKFKVHEFPTGSMRVSDLRRLIENYKAKGIVFDLVIVDYADLMAPERFVDNSIENSKSVYVALRGLAMQENIALLTATQTNREGAKKVVATMTDIAEDFNKVRIADIVISINRTEEERSTNQARLYFAAVRNGPSGFTIRVQQDLGRMRFISAVIGEE
jgi:replicative DNA helicase